MKYLLIEHGEALDPHRVRIFEHVDARARATREAILGPPNEQNQDTPCPELLTLSTEGRVDFEGDPSLEWIDAEVVDEAKTPRELEMEELLRSACAIAERNGHGTHWKRFIASINKLGLNGITARTYRVLASDEI